MGLESGFTVIVPCYNEENALLQTIHALRKELAGLGPYELVMVDDGSTDRTADLLRESQEEDSELKALFHGRNRGYGAALKTGIRNSSSPIIVIADADGTYPFDRIGDLLEEMKTADMVVGARVGEGVTYPFIRKIPKVFLKAYSSWLVNQDIPDMNSGLRAFKKPIAERFINILPDGFSFTTTITLAMMSNYLTVKFIPISYAARVGQSKIQPIRDTARFIQLIVRTGVYFAPLRVFMPMASLLFVGFLGSLSYDIFSLGNITDKSIILLLFALNTTMFALLADMIDKRCA